MILDERQNETNKITPEGGEDFIRHNADAPPVPVPRGYVGPIYMSNGRQVWWTGRVAIGLRHRPPLRNTEMTESARWLQRLMLENSAASVPA